MKWKVLVSAPYAMAVIEMYRVKLEAAGCAMSVGNVKERMSEAELLPLVVDIDGMICGDDEITERVLLAAPRLKVISKWGTGIDSIDLSAAKSRNVAVRNTPNAFSEPVADTVLGYMLLFARRLNDMDRNIRDGRWIKPEITSLREKTLGVIGVGNCGKAVVRRAIAFGMDVLGNDVVEISDDEFANSGRFVMTSLEDLLLRSDFVTLHTTLNPTSYHLMNKRTFSLLQPASYLINTCRGPVVDEAALVQALREKKIAGAALDVFEVEPLPASSALRGFENCKLAPHNANGSPLAAARVHENTIQNLLDVLQDK